MMTAWQKKKKNETLEWEFERNHTYSAIHKADHGTGLGRPLQNTSQGHSLQEPEGQHSPKNTATSPPYHVAS